MLNFVTSVFAKKNRYLSTVDIRTLPWHGRLSNPIQVWLCVVSSTHRLGLAKVSLINVETAVV